MRFSGAVIIFVSVMLAIGIPAADACTTFWSRTNDGAVVAKSFDWGISAGWVVLNERGRVRTKLVAGGGAETASWRARFASLSFTTVGPGFPISGMNEAGLAIESLVDLSVRPTTLPDPARLTGLELVQFGLDHYASAAEFASFAERAGVSQLGVALHFFACDRRGECLVVEPHPDGTHVTRGAELHVRALANRPWSDDWDSLEPSTLRRFFNSFRSSTASEPHFATVARVLRADRPRDTSDAFSVLASVETPGLTVWQIVWNLDKGEVRWRERGSERIATLRLADEDVSCRGPSRVRPIGSASPAAPFAPWSTTDAARAQAAVVAQVPLRGSEARRLASSVAVMTLKSECAP
jgi:choloylglycine hydrolase